VREEIHLNHGAGREDGDHRARARFDFRRGFAYFDAGDPLDLVPEGL